MLFGIMAALNGDKTHTTTDIGGGNGNDCFCDIIHRQAQHIPQRMQGIAGRLGLQRHAPAQEGFGADPPHRDQGIGHSRLSAAATITGWSRLGPCRLGPDLQHAAIVDPPDAAAACPDIGNVNGRHANRQPINFCFCTNARGTIGNQADIRAGPANIQGDQFLIPKPMGN